MGKVFGWILSFTKAGKAANPVQKALSGKKSYLSGLALAVPALITILLTFSDQGVPYLLHVSNSPEFMALMNGIGLMGLRAAITKAADPAKDPNIKDGVQA